MKERMLTEFFPLTLGVFLLTWLILRKLIPVLKSKKIGQKIYDIGPRWHKGKEGTPIMGGLGFIIAAAVGLAVVTGVYAYLGRARELLGVWLTFTLALLNGLIGFFDDYTKLIKKQNEGLTPKQKLVFQFGSAAIYLAGLKMCGALTTEIVLPFCGI